MKKVILLASAIITLVSASCSSDHEEHGHENSKFQVTSPVRMDTTLTKEYVCQIHSIQHIELRALEKGYLQNIYVDEGQAVKKGQLMFQIMPMMYEAEMHKAKAEANYAKIEYENTKALADKDVVSQNELALAKAKYEKALAELELSQVHLGFTQIKAPFDGIMDRFHVRLGSLLDEGELLTELSDNSNMWVYFNVPEAEYLDYMFHAKEDKNTDVSLLMANNRVFDQKGEISTIEADFNNETGNIAFRATFPNPEGMLRHGETGTIRLTSPVKDALIIPQKTTFEILEKKYVFVVDKDNVLHARNIEVAAELPHLFIVSKGLKEGDKILLEGLRKVKENDKIKYDFIQPKEAISSLELYAE